MQTWKPDAAWQESKRVRIDTLRVGSWFRDIDGNVRRLKEVSSSGVSWYHPGHGEVADNCCYAGCAEVVPWAKDSP